MGPLGFLTGIVLGSAVSVVTVLTMVLAVYLVISPDHPRVMDEYPGLLRAILLFAGLTAVAAVAFRTLQRRSRWRGLAQAAMWGTLCLIGWSYWP